MSQDLLDLYDRASEWTTSRVAGAANRLDAPTPCDDWDVRTLLRHVLETQRFFLETARGHDTSVPAPNPSGPLSDDPHRDFVEMRVAMLNTFGEPGVIEKTGMALAVAFSDLLVHGWDVARATDQDATMPNGLAAAAFELIHGRFTDEQRKGLFKPAIPMPDDAPAQDRLLAYTGRRPD